MPRVTRACVRLAALALVLSLGFARVGSAHAILVGSQPKESSEVTGPDVDVSLEFNSRIDAARSSLQLTRAGATDHDLPPVGAAPEPLAVSGTSEPNKLEAKATGLEPGSYRLRWQVLSVDGHVSRGDVTFKVRAP